MRMQDRPLSGIRVLDLTNVLAGPYCSYQLMLFGAEVIKIEIPGQGDLARRLGPDPDLNEAGLGASFLAQNAGKKSVELNLKDPDDRLAFAWPQLSALRPGLIYCAISGFGQTGPMRHVPAYDQIIQGLSGMMSITG